MAKAAVLICNGCDIGSSVDVTALERVAGEDPQVTVRRSVPCLCDTDGGRIVKECVDSGVDALVVAACSPRVHTKRFLFDGCRTERVNLRELVVWSHAPNDEDTQMLAEDTLRVGVVRALKSEAPEPATMHGERTVLVLGAGPAGLAAARGAARAGHPVVLVEKRAELGGWLRSWHRTLPSRPPYRELEPSPLDALLDDVEGDGRIEVHRNATLAGVSGQPGAFEVDVAVGETRLRRRVGAIVQATGWKPYDASRLSHLGYGQSPDVVTSIDFDRSLAGGSVVRPSDGKRPTRIAFVQCAGSRDAEHLAYCSTVCCRVTLKQALWTRELDPHTEVYVLARDLRAPGLHEDFYRRAQEDPGILFAKGSVLAVTRAEAGTLCLEVESPVLGGRVAIEADLVVLAIGMVPVAADGEGLRALADTERELSRAEGAAIEPLRARVSQLKVHEGTALLQLSYRQGPDLPAARHGFSDSLFTCFPYETRRTGIYTAGCVRAPGDIEASRVDGEGAALKAIQAIAHATVGAAMHPRWGDLTTPRFSLSRCTQCKRCTEECPFGALDEDEKGTPKPNLSRCRRCGICLGACPERVVSFADYSIDIVSSMIKAVHIPDEFEEKPRILVLLCENDAYPALDLAGFHRHRFSSYVRTIPVRCLGAVNVVWIADALARGYDGILLLGCKSGDDTQCHFVRGSELMAKRSENVRLKLQQLALEEERVQVQHVALSEYRTLPGLIDAFVHQIEKLGLNPFKDA